MTDSPRVTDLDLRNEIGRQLRTLDLRSVSERDALDLLGLLLRIRGREVSK